MAGIIGHALAGAVEGAGFGGAAVGKQVMEHEFEKEKQAILERREINLANTNNAAADRRQERGHEQAVDLEQNVRQPFQASENAATRTHAEGLQRTQLEHAARENAANRQVQRDGQGLQARQLAILERGAALDHEIKQIQVNNAKDVDTLRTQYRAETDPAKRQQISDNISVLTGKDSDKFLPVPLKDDMGNITGYEIFDTKRGQFVDNPRAGGAATGAKWDSGSGKVMLDGREIGKASNEAEARALVAKARSGSQATPAGGQAPAGQPRPVRGVIESAMNYPEALDQFNPRKPAIRTGEEEESTPMMVP